MSKVDKITSFRQKQFFESSPTSRAISEMLVERSKQAALTLGVELLEKRSRWFAARHIRESTANFFIVAAARRAS